MKGFVLILLMICPWPVNAQSLHYAMSYDTAFMQAKEEGKMVLVYAYSPCRLCDDMTEKVLSLTDIAVFLNSHLILVDMDMDERVLLFCCLIIRENYYIRWWGFVPERNYWLKFLADWMNGLIMQW